MKRREPATKRLATRWKTGEIPLSEYPRPQFVRGNYMILNGLWDYAIRKKGEPFGAADGKILVPYSPETLLSGVMRTLRPDETLYYERKFDWKQREGERTLLNFGAVDMDAEVFLNGKRVGGHRGGYNAFRFEITEYLKEGENTLRVIVSDETDAGFRTRSKQTFSRGGIWYSPTSGIWQTVWLERVAERYLEDFEILTDFDDAGVAVRVIGGDNTPIEVFVTDAPIPLPTRYDGAENTEYQSAIDCARVVASGKGIGEARVALDGFEAWSPESPKLYGLIVRSDSDTVTSYFGMRKFEVRPDANLVPRFYLNNRPYFLHGLLDQGYFSDGMYTAPADDALIYDISLAKKLGFNTLRKHIKVEPMRWYYHADRLGVVVMQDMPSGGAKYRFTIVSLFPFLGKQMDDSRYRLFGREDKASREEFLTEYREMLSELKNVTSIGVWVPFNEGWGQFDANKVARLTREADPARPVDHASGWHDQDGGNFKSLHVYFRPVRKIKKERKRAVILSEFGGYSLKREGHVFNLDKTFGYKVFESEEDFNRAFEALYDRDVVRHIGEGLSGDVYTELTDVEDEVNGLVTFDRAVTKLNEATALTVKDKINHAFEKAVAEVKKESKSAQKKGRKSRKKG